VAASSSSPHGVVVSCVLLVGCSSGGAGEAPAGALATDAAVTVDASTATPIDAGGGRNDADSSASTEAGMEGDDAASGKDAAGGEAGGPSFTCTSGDAGADAGCYAISCDAGGVHSLQANRDRLIGDLAQRKCTDPCSLWAALNQGERYIFLMDTTYLGAPSSLLHPPGSSNQETALDHAIALYSINGPDAGQGVLLNGLGGNDYNRIYLGFDALASCVMRDFAIANPSHEAGYNEWVKSDDLAGPHAPFTQRNMIAWFKALLDLQTQGPQFHFWHQDSDFTQSGLNQRLGVCGVTDPTITELTIAFDSVHDSDPLGTYPSDGASNGGTGSQIVDQFAGIDAEWSYMPSGCPTTPAVNTSVTGGGTFAGMGPSLEGSVCGSASLGDGGACP
jgi:hypothetical protein